MSLDRDLDERLLLGALGFSRDEDGFTRERDAKPLLQRIGECAVEARALGLGAEVSSLLAQAQAAVRKGMKHALADELLPNTRVRR